MVACHRTNAGRGDGMKKGGALLWTPPAILLRGGGYWIASFLVAVEAFFGRVSSSTPSLYLAWALASSTS